jgi:hypothetical protein
VSGNAVGLKLSGVTATGSGRVVLVVFVTFAAGFGLGVGVGVGVGAGVGAVASLTLVLMLLFTSDIPLGIAESNDATSEEGIVIACPATSSNETGTPLTVPNG